MIVFFFYLVAILTVLTLCAAVADFSLWLQERKHAEAEASRTRKRMRGTGF